MQDTVRVVHILAHGQTLGTESAVVLGVILVPFYPYYFAVLYMNLCPASTVGTAACRPNCASDYLLSGISHVSPFLLNLFFVFVHIRLRAATSVQIRRLLSSRLGRIAVVASTD